VRELLPAHFHTPGIISMEEQAKAFNLPLDHASKFYLFRGTKGDAAYDIGVVLRSDHEPNLAKVKSLAGVDFIELTPIADAERLAGAPSGFIGPVELDVPVYVDRSLQEAFMIFGWRPNQTPARAVARGVIKVFEVSKSDRFSNWGSSIPKQWPATISMKAV
jgi:prolyl-tRNA editing enzyme YbaK/EbsC (Cys-tRNA(Pro) deacylase)